MKKPFLNLIVILILIIGSVLLLQTNFVHAEETSPGIISSAIRSAVNPILADFANLTMTVASWALIFAGYVLDVSIKLTLNIKDFVNATPAIFTVWKTLRDITGLFFIFYLLYAAIQMMTGLGKESYGSTIKNIVIAGVLINFSFFIVSIGIDASNITSQAIYNAMVPNSQTMKINEKTGLAEIVRDNGQSKISNIFMNSLRIQKIYDTKGNRLGTNITDPIKIVLIGITGVIMMLTAAASLILAALAFIARLVILLFLLAFSSLWFAGKVIPQVRDQVKMFEGAFYSQLIFMPVYLLLMYVALSIINGSNFFSAGDIGGVASTITGPNWIMPYIIIGVNFAIVIFILNLPLVIGLSMGSHATDWLKKSIGKWDAGNVWKNVGLWTKNRAVNTVASVPQNVVGQGAYSLNKSGAMNKLASWSPTIGMTASKGLSKVSSASFGGKKGGYEGAVKQRKKEVEAMYKQISDNSSKETKELNQEKFRSNLTSSILSKVLSRRADKETAEKLNKIAMKAENKSKKKDYQKEVGNIESQIKLINGNKLNQALLSDTEKAKIVELEKRRDELQEKIDKANEDESEERDSKILEGIKKELEGREKKEETKKT